MSEYDTARKALHSGSVCAPDAGRLSRGTSLEGLLRACFLLALFAAAALSGCAGAGSSISPDQVDFGGNELSHGRP